MVGWSMIMFRVTQSWFMIAYALALTTAIITKHHWRFISANVASLATIVAVAGSGFHIRASLATTAYKAALLNIELPFGLSHFPICIFMAFAASLFFCDGIAYDIFGKFRLKKAIIATIFSGVSVVLNMVMFLIFGYVVVAINHFNRIFMLILIVSLISQFCFTLFTSLLDSIFIHFPRLRPIYILTFIMVPVLYTFCLYEFYMQGLLTTTISSIQTLIKPLTYSDLIYVGITIIILILIGLGMMCSSAIYSSHAILYALNYLIIVSVPIGSILTSLIKRRGFNCHRTLASFYDSAFGVFSTVLFATCAIIIAFIPLIVGQPGPNYDKNNNKRSQNNANKKNSSKKVKSE